ncbi:MAG: redoxin domain-containing protein [Verrucomicrobia bacterium]|nr:redoxin domain-containing protein [Verrucomicrobiota bacterium]
MLRRVFSPLFAGVFSVASLAAAAETPADIELADANGAKHRPLAAQGQNATVLLFLAHDCPISNAYAPEINRIVTDYSARKVACYLVYVEADLTGETVKKHAEEFGFKATALLDPKHKLVKLAQATVTPEAAVFSPEAKLLYRGRIDDLFADIGKRRQAPTTHELRDALDAVLAGKPVKEPTTKAIGCFIEPAKP